MSGVLGGLLASLKSGIVNLIQNGSATTNPLGSKWVTGIRATTLTAGTPRTAPASIVSAYSLSLDGDAIEYYDSSAVLTVGQRYSLSGYLYNFQGGPLEIFASLQTGNTTSNTGFTIPVNSWTRFTVENQLCTINGILDILIYSASGNTFVLDDLALVQGATAL